MLPITQNLSGVTLILDPISHVKTTSIVVAVNVGSATQIPEEQQLPGICHVIEHMLFKGSTKFPHPHAISQALDDLGGNFNAYTSHDVTVYHAKILADNIEPVVAILADMLQNPLFDPVELEKEKRVIIEEIKGYESVPDRVVAQALYREAFKGQRFGESIAGTRESVEKISSSNLASFVQQHYCAENVCIGISGKIDIARLTEIVEKHFGNMRKRPGLQPASPSPIYSGGEIRIPRHETEHTHMLIGFPAPSIHDPEYYVTEVMSIIVGGSMSSRLFKEIRENLGLAYSIGSDYHSFDNNGLFVIHANADKENIAQIVNLTHKQLYEALSDISNIELERAKLQIISDICSAEESSLSRASKCASDYLTFNRYISGDETIEKVKAVDISSITRVMKQIFFSNAAKPTIALVGQEPTFDYRSMIDMFHS